VPPPRLFVESCRFAPRCPFAVDPCRQERPPLRKLAGRHEVACLRAPLEAHVGLPESLRL
jgi:oligopeptide/dipeptide ABC transporter ATP-binding protein